MNKNDTDIDEEKVQKDHQQVYGQGNTSGMTSSSLGAWVISCPASFQSGVGVGDEDEDGDRARHVKRKEFILSCTVW